MNDVIESNQKKTTPERLRERLREDNKRAHGPPRIVLWYDYKAGGSYHQFSCLTEVTKKLRKQ